MQTLDRLALIGGVLGREAEKAGDAELLVQPRAPGI